MNKLVIIGFFLSFVLLAPSCHHEKDTEKNTVTKRIQYDVFIQNPDPDMDWWVQNLEGSNREKLVSDILTRVREGKVKAYDFLTYKAYTVDEIAAMMKRVDSISVERSTPPYDLVDTVLVTEIRMADITKLRFLEEWKMDDKTLEFSKKVAGICPLVERHTDSGELRGYKPLFWVFFDDKYPAELQKR